MEHGHHESIAAFFTPDTPIAGTPQTLGEDVVRHMHVRRLVVGASVRLLDGAGHVASGTLARLGKHQAVVDVQEVVSVAPLPAVHLCVPIADRDRMLLLAEKSVELGASSWRPVLWRRSRSVSPRGEGITFVSRLRARMASALVQSGSAWMPTVYPEATVERAAAAAPAGTRLLLDPGGQPMLSVPLTDCVTLALGPEGGVEDDERDLLVASGFLPVALGGHMLRFESAGIAALVIVRAMLHNSMLSGASRADRME